MENIPTNRLSITSLALALLAMLSLCIGMAPIPFSDLVCYPSSFLLGLAAVMTGLFALWQVRGGKEAGRGLALAGVVAGALAVILMLCLTVIAITVLPVIYEYAVKAWNAIWPWK